MSEQKNKWQKQRVFGALAQKNRSLSVDCSKDGKCNAKQALTMRQVSKLRRPTVDANDVENLRFVLKTRLHFTNSLAEKSLNYAVECCNLSKILQENNLNLTESLHREMELLFERQLPNRSANPLFKQNSVTMFCTRADGKANIKDTVASSKSPTSFPNSFNSHAANEPSCKYVTTSSNDHASKAESSHSTTVIELATMALSNFCYGELNSILSNSLYNVTSMLGRSRSDSLLAYRRDWTNMQAIFNSNTCDTVNKRPTKSYYEIGIVDPTLSSRKKSPKNVKAKFKRAKPKKAKKKPTKTRDSDKKFGDLSSQYSHIDTSKFLLSTTTESSDSESEMWWPKSYSAHTIDIPIDNSFVSKMHNFQKTIAKYAFEAGKYEDAYEACKTLIKLKLPLAYGERMLFWMSAKALLSRHMQFLVAYKPIYADDAKFKLETHMLSHVTNDFRALKAELLALIDEKLMPAVKQHNYGDTVFYYRICGDIYRYYHRVLLAANDVRQHHICRIAASKAYEQGLRLAVSHLDVVDPERLAIVLNYAVFYYQNMRKPHKTVILLKDTFLMAAQCNSMYQTSAEVETLFSNMFNFVDTIKADLANAHSD